MKKRSFSIWMICGVLLLFTSCSKDDPASVAEEERTGTLFFGAVLNDLTNKMGVKQAVQNLPECTDSAPSYVAVVLSGTTAVGTMEDPLIVPISPTAGDYDNDGDDEYFTMESPDLELPPGTYSLDFFAVYDDADNLLWLAPTEGGDLGDWVNPLPLEFELGRGVKKYLDVNVLCYDSRFLNRYGYLFFRFEGTEVTEFCLFGNVCDENGRHAPANFRFDVWTYSGDPANPKGVAIFNENDPFVNTVGVNSDGDAYADPLCIFLPGTIGEDTYYGEIYLLENGGSTLIRSGEFTDANVRELFDGEERADYYHFREGCGQTDSTDFFGQGGDPGEISTIADYITANSKYRTLVRALELAGLMSFVEGADNHTVFLPDNNAFAHYLGINGYSSLDDVPMEVLTQLLLYHIQPGNLISTDLTSGYIESIAKAPALDEFLSMFIETSGGLTINGEVEVIDADIELENGVIHTVAAVIDLPTVWTFITADPNLSHHRDAHLGEWQDLNVPRLREEGSYTLLVPINEAWEREFEESRISGPEELNYSVRQLVLDTHRLLYSNLRSTDFWEGELNSASESDYTVTLNLGDPITVTDVTDQTYDVVKVDIQATNGVLHLIDGVLLL